MSLYAIVSYKIGEAFGIELVAFPITYLAMKKQFKLRKPNGAWLPFSYGVAAFTLLFLLGYRSDSTMTFILPIVVNAIILKFAYSGAEPQHASNNNVKTNDKGGNTELMIFASEGDVVNAKLLLASGTDVYARNEQGATALIIAVLNNQPLMVSLLLENGADASIASNKRLTAKALATKNGNNEILKLLNAVQG